MEHICDGCGRHYDCTFVRDVYQRMDGNCQFCYNFGAEHLTRCPVCTPSPMRGLAWRGFLAGYAMYLRNHLEEVNIFDTPEAYGQALPRKRYCTCDGCRR